MDLSAHRKFYINGKLEFALLSNLNIKDKNKVLELFFNSKDWVEYKKLYKLKGEATQIKVSEDTMEIQIIII